MISYRGTDNCSPFTNSVSGGSDWWGGWSIGAGFEDGSQAELAKAFYQQVTGQDVYQQAPSNVVLTGHSLGGGLAGYVSTLSGATGVGFDHMRHG